MDRKIQLKFLFILGLAAAVMPSAVHAQRGRTEVADGNQLYSEGEFEAARERYLDALRAAPEVPLIRFNEGNALYQTDDFEEASNSYMAAIDSDDPALQAESWYNIGNAMFRLDNLEESLEAFKEALRLNPDDGDARHNLELVLRRMQEEQNREQGDGESQDQDQPENPDPQNQDQDEDQQQQGQQDQNQDQQEQEPDRQPNEDEQQQGQQQPPPAMTREEAERLLQAIDEDPNEVRRQQRRTRGRVTVAKDW